MSEFEGIFTVTKKQRYLYQLAKEYHRRTENFDRFVCTGPMGKDGILPRDFRELEIINKNATQVKHQLRIRALLEMGISANSVTEAISRYRRKP